MGLSATTTLIVLLLTATTLITGKEEACHSFGEGLVYPRETASAGSHKLSVSKVTLDIRLFNI